MPSSPIPDVLLDDDLQRVRPWLKGVSNASDWHQQTMIKRLQQDLISYRYMPQKAATRDKQIRSPCADGRLLSTALHTSCLVHDAIDGDGDVDVDPAQLADSADEYEFDVQSEADAEPSAHEDEGLETSDQSVQTNDGTSCLRGCPMEDDAGFRCQRAHDYRNASFHEDDCPTH